MGLKLFGLVSPRGDFKSKTTLHGWAGGGLVVNVDNIVAKRFDHSGP